MTARARTLRLGFSLDMFITSTFFSNKTWVLCFTKEREEAARTIGETSRSNDQLRMNMHHVPCTRSSGRPKASWAVARPAGFRVGSSLVPSPSFNCGGRKDGLVKTA